MSDYGNFMPTPGFVNTDLGVPATNEAWNIYNAAMSPSTVHLKDNLTFGMYMRYFLKKAIDAFEWKMPKEWSQDYFLYTLYNWGYMAVFYTWQYGVVAQFPALQGYTLMYQPSDITVDNQWLHNVKRKIGKNCVVFKAMPDYRGLTDLISNYAAEMALADETIEINMVNSHVSMMFAVDDNKMAQDMRKLYDQIGKGEPAVFYKKRKKGMLEDDESGKLWEVFNPQVRQTYIVSDVLSDKRKIENAFNTWFGIPNTNVEKKERMSTNEVESNNADTHTFAGALLKRFKEYCRQVNAMFPGTNMSVDWNEAIRKQMESAQEGGNGNAINLYSNGNA